jgi:hypothetical protein
MLYGKRYFRKPLNTKAICAVGFRNSMTCVALPATQRILDGSSILLDGAQGVVQVLPPV